MSVQWQWVLAALISGLALTLFLEMRRQRQPKPGLLLALLLILAAAFVFVRLPLNVISAPLPVVEQGTAVSLPAALSPVPTLPPPSISLTEGQKGEQAAPPTASLPPTRLPETAVRRLRIPALTLNLPVQTVPLINGEWDVTALGGAVGWLESTASTPDNQGAMVFVGHMTYPHQRLLEEGAFAHIPTLPYGSAVILETDGGAVTYLVDSVRRVAPDDVAALYQEAGNTILLLTCADWNQQQGIYENRLLVRAVRK